MRIFAGFQQNKNLMRMPWFVEFAAMQYDPCWDRIVYLSITLGVIGVNINSHRHAPPGVLFWQIYGPRRMRQGQVRIDRRRLLDKLRRFRGFALLARRVK